MLTACLLVTLKLKPKGAEMNHNKFCQFNFEFVGLKKSFYFLQLLYSGKLVVFC